MKKKKILQEKMVDHIHKAIETATDLEDLIYEETNYKDLDSDEKDSNCELGFVLEDMKALLSIAINLYAKRSYL
jgi:hypothetical protein